MQQSRATIVSFPPFEVDLLRATVQCNGESRALRRQSFAVLQVLIERRDRVQSVADLVGAVWTSPPSHPDASVTQCIKDIRKALGPDHEWMIKTVTGAGYQFAPEIKVVTQPRGMTTPEAAAPSKADVADEPASMHAVGAAPADPHQPAAEFHARLLTALPLLLAVAALVSVSLLRPTSRETPPPSIAAVNPTTTGSIAPVLEAPLTMLAKPTLAVVARLQRNNPQDPSAGLIEQLATELRRAPKGYSLTLKVPPTEPYGYEPVDQVAQALAVRYVLTTSVTPDERKAVVFQLHENPGGRQIWAYSTDLAQITAEPRIMTRLGREVVTRIRSSENRRPLPAVVAAGHLIIKGRSLLEGERDREMNERAKSLFEQAVALDRTEAQGLLGYARTRVVALANRWEPEGQTATYFEEARQAVDEVIALDPGSFGGHLLRGAIARVAGDTDGAIAAFRHTLTLNANYPLAYAELGRVLIDKEDYAGALASINRAISLSPGDPVSSFWYYWAGIAAGLAGDHRASLDWMQRSRQTNPRYQAVPPWIAIAYEALGERDNAQKVIREHLQAVPHFTAARWVNVHVRRAKRLTPRFEALSAHLVDIGVPKQ